MVENLQRRQFVSAGALSKGTEPEQLANSLRLVEMSAHGAETSSQRHSERVWGRFPDVSRQAHNDSLGVYGAIPLQVCQVRVAAQARQDAQRFPKAHETWSGFKKLGMTVAVMDRDALLMHYGPTFASLGGFMFDYASR